MLVALSLLNGAASALAMPAAAAITPQTVEATELAQASALARMMTNTGRVTGGVLVAAIGPGWAIGANAALFLLAAMSYRGLRLPDRKDTRARSRPLAELAEGWHEFRSRTWVWVVVIQFMVVNAVTVGGVVVLGPVIADDTFGRAGWGFVLAAQTVGSIAGGFLAAKWQPRRALLVGVAVTLIDVLPMLTLAQAPQVIPLLIAMFITGMSMEQFGVAWEVSLQENVPADRLARVYSYDMLGSLIAVPAGEVAAGPLSEHLGRETTLLAGAALVAVTTGLACAAATCGAWSGKCPRTPKQRQFAAELPRPSSGAAGPV